MIQVCGWHFVEICLIREIDDLLVPVSYQINSVIRCTWPNSINGQIEYTRGSSKSEIFTDCRYDVDLVTITRHGCTISPMNPNIHYHLTLVQNGASIESIAEFDPREFRKWQK